MKTPSRPDPLHFNILDRWVCCIVGALNTARTSSDLKVSVHSSKDGFAIKINGKVFAEGKTPRELYNAYQSAVDKSVTRAEEGARS